AEVNVLARTIDRDARIETGRADGAADVRVQVVVRVHVDDAQRSLVELPPDGASLTGDRDLPVDALQLEDAVPSRMRSCEGRRGQQQAAEQDKCEPRRHVGSLSCRIMPAMS